LHRACFLALFLCAGFLSFNVFHLNAEPLILSLEDALGRGIENSLTLKKSLIDLSSAEYSASKLWSEVFPTINGSIGTEYRSNLFSSNGFQFSGDNLYMNASVGITLTLNPGIPYTMNNIKLAYQARLLSHEDARNQLEIQITKNFYNLIADRDNLTTFDYMMQLAQRQYERDQVAFNNGLINELTLMQSRLGLENARYNLSAARSAHANRMGDFLAQLGITPDTEAALDGKIEIVKVELDAEQLIREHLLRRPDIVGRRQEIERLENAEKQATYSAKAPSLNFSARWNSSNFSPFADTLSGSATLNIPIDPWIPGTGKSQSVRSAKLAVDKARLDLQSTEDAAATQIRSLAANLRNSWDSIEIARLSLSVAERGYELTELGFRNGTVESLKLEDARNNLMNARQRLLQTELSYLNMILDISAALNIGWKDLMR
jgi:outer membrane protein TolC